MEPLSIRSYPRAILHFDGDAFFASVEQSLDHTLKGKPVVTGAERGAATSISYEAKALGVTRGMNMQEIRRACPSAIIVPGNYTAYSIYARRMYSIVRSYTPTVEEYSIDECFADITGLRGRYRMPYEEIALMIKARLEEELGITFGVGLGPSKTVAKCASKYRKPAGFTAIPAKELHTYLADMRIGSIWGLGGVSSLYLEKLGVMTALQLARKPEGWLEENRFGKPIREIWLELNGHFVKPLSTKPREEIGSVMKTHTFRATTDRTVLLAELSKNIENACAGLRRHRMKAKAAAFYLKTQEFTYQNVALSLPLATHDPGAVLASVLTRFDDAYERGIRYRATGITLRDLVPEGTVTYDLFGVHEEAQSAAPILAAVDAVNRRYGRHTVHLASSHQALIARSRDLSARTGARVAMDIEQRKKTLEIPYLGKVR